MPESSTLGAKDLGTWREAVKAERLRRGMTQQLLAEAAGVSRTFIQAFEAGSGRKPQAQKVQKVLDVLGLGGTPSESWDEMEWQVASAAVGFYSSLPPGARIQFVLELSSLRDRLASDTVNRGH
jgi:transcriptional regulator with XRE-family HTH domain